MQSESQLEQAKAQVTQADADVARAEANQKKTELDVARDTPLAERGSISQQELDNAVQANLANLASLKAARASLANAQAGVPRAQAAIAQARAVLDNAQLNHSWAKVFSPIIGIAGIKNARPDSSQRPSYVTRRADEVIEAQRAPHPWSRHLLGESPVTRSPSKGVGREKVRHHHGQAETPEEGSIHGAHCTGDRARD